MQPILTFKPLRKNYWIAKPDMLYFYYIEKQGYKYIARYSHVCPLYCKSLGVHFAFILAKNACIKHRAKAVKQMLTICKI